MKKINLSALISFLLIQQSLQAVTPDAYPAPCTDTPVAIANHSATFRGVLYDYPSEGQSTWYYSFQSGTRPAISHVTFSLPCPDLRIVQAGMWNGTDYATRFVNAGMPAPKSGAAANDPTTNLKGLKFDLGFNDNATHHYFFTVNGNYAAALIPVALKAGPGFTIGNLCGPAAGCDEEDQKADLSSLGDFVWLDSNANGIQDEDETGVEGITVRLLTPSGDLIMTTITNDSGLYLFENLLDGDYRVEFVLPPNAPYFFTAPEQGSDTALDSDADQVTGLTAVIPVPAATHRRDIDAGLVPTTASIRITKEGVYIPGTLDPWNLCTVFGAAHAFNALIFGDFFADGGDTEGKLAVAGNLTIPGGYSVGYALMGHDIPEQSGGLTDMLIVGGDYADGVFGVNGNIVIGGLRTGPVRWMVNGNLLRHVNPIRFNEQGNVPSTGEGLLFEEMKTLLQVRSTVLGGRASTGTVSESDTGLLLKGENEDLNIFTVSRMDFTSEQVTIDVPAGSTVLVNFSANSFEFKNGGIQVLGTSAENVLFNFPNATLLKAGGFQITASVLAPFAAGEFSGGSIDGRAVLGGNVNSQNGFEFHNFPFTGEICMDPLSPGNPPAISYTFTVENTGNIPLSNVYIVDPLVSVNGGPISLEPGEIDSGTFTATLLLTAADLEDESFTNTAWAYATLPGGHSICAKDTHVLNFPPPAPFVPPVTGEYPILNKADFVMKSLTLPSHIGNHTETFSVTVQISNEGDKPGDAGILRIWPALAQLEPELGDSHVDMEIGHMGVGAVKTMTVSGLKPSGSYGTIHVRAEIITETPEYSSGNNHTSDTYFFENPDSPWLKPDFVVRSVQLTPLPGIAGARFTALVLVANDGNKTGDAGNLAVWAGSPVYSANLSGPDQSVPVGVLAPGETKTITVENLQAPNQFGTFHTMAIVNHLGAADSENAFGNNHVGVTYSLIPVAVEMTAVAEGNRISWNSQPGYYYFVERATSLEGEFEQIADNLAATVPLNVFVDTAPPSGGLVFYRVWGYRP